MCGLQNRVSFAKPICFHFLNREKLVNIGKSPQNLKKVNQKPVFLFSGDGTALEMQEISFRIERISWRRKLRDFYIFIKIKNPFGVPVGGLVFQRILRVIVQL